MKVRFIFNPYSGRNRKNPYLYERAVSFIAQERLDGTIVRTERARHGTELARRAVDEGCELVVAIGGDGTMNEVADGLVGSPAIFGLIPCGSGNGLGRHLGIRKPGRGAFQTLLRGRPKAIDTGVVNGFSFFNAMGLGIEADIAVRFSRQTNRGLAGYIRVGVPAFFSHQPETCVVHQGRTTHKLTAFTLAVMNSDQYGNDARIAPGAKLDDGRFELVSVPRDQVAQIQRRLFEVTHRALAAPDALFLREGQLHGMVVDVWPVERLAKAPAKGMRIAAHALVARWAERQDVRGGLALGIEQLGGFVGA